MLEIHNNGQQIVSSNYWDSEPNGKGLFFCSINAGAFRLLVDSGTNGELVKPMLEAARNATEIVVSRGWWTEKNAKDAFEFLFDDDPDTPWVIQMVNQQFDRLPALEDEGREFQLFIYDAGKMVFQGVCKYRRVRRLPCMKPFAATGGREV